MPLEVLGGPELEARLMELGEMARGEELSQAVKPAAELVFETAYALVPKRSDMRLASSLFVEEGIVASDGAEWLVGTEKKVGWYAPFVELGTGPHEQHGGASVHPGASPRPFLRPALDTNQDAIPEIIAEQLAAAFEAVGAGA